MKRRDFFKIIGVGGAGTVAGLVLGKAGTPPGAKLIPYLIPPENVIPGVANWYASLCTQCSAGCGAIVKIVDGRAKKIEGNKLHPINKGKLCARGQAGLNALYNPDRIQGPLKRKGSRGSGSFEEISWDEAISILSKNLAALGKAGEAEKLAVLSSPIRGHLDSLISRFMAAFGSSNYTQYELFQHNNLSYANQAALGLDNLPYYDIENTNYLLSFGADFSTTWLSPVNLSHGYGRMRQGEPGRRGRLVQVEPRMSVTGAVADEWVPAKPGTEAVLALAIANAIIEKGLYRGADASGWRAVLSGYRPKDVADVTEVSEERIIKIAREFAETRPSLAIGGENVSSYENGVSGIVAVNILNHIAGNIGVKGGIIPNPDGLIAGRGKDSRGGKKITALAASASASKIKTLIVYNANPVFTTPKAVKMEDSLRNIPFIASMSSFMDETTALADLILPAHTSFEEWGDDVAEPGAGYSAATMMQPVVSPVFNTRALGDIFISVAKAMDGKVKERMPDKDFEAYLKDSWKELYSKDRAMAGSAADFDQFWTNLLQNGGWWPSERQGKKALTVSTRNVSQHIPVKPASFEGDARTYPFYLVLYPHPGFLDGRGANLPSLQELPDPVTSVVWGSWVEINPRTAEKIGVKEGDLVTIESPYGRVDVPVYLYQGIRPDTVAIPIGQGHSAYGRYAKDRGANPLDILPFKEDPRTGAPALNSTRVRVSTAGGKGDMVKIEGTTRELGRNIIHTISPEEFNKLKKGAV